MGANYFVNDSMTWRGRIGERVRVFVNDSIAPAIAK